jgi:hypothetical protein
MKKVFSSGVLMLLALVLSGCGVYTKQVPIYKTTVTYVYPPETLYQKCYVPMPPNIDAYIMMTIKERENALTNYSIRLLNGLMDCNVELYHLKDYIDKSKTINASFQKK